MLGCDVPPLREPEESPTWTDPTDFCPVVVDVAPDDSLFAEPSDETASATVAGCIHRGAGGCAGAEVDAAPRGHGTESLTAAGATVSV